MADVIRNDKAILQRFLLVLSNGLSPTLDLVLRGGMNLAESEIVIKGVRSINDVAAPGSESDYILLDKSNATKSVRGTVQNVCEINTRFVSLTETTEALESQRLASELSDRIIEIKNSINSHMFNGVYKTTDPRAMGSITKDVPAENKFSDTYANFSKSDFVDFILQLKKAGMPTHLMAGYEMAELIVAKLKSTETRDQSSSIISLDTNKIIVAGCNLTIHLDQAIGANKAIVGDPQFLEYYYIKPLRTTPLAKNGLTTDHMISTEGMVLNRCPKIFGTIEFTV